MSEEKMCVRIETRFSAAEARELEKRAAEEERSLANYLRRVALAGMRLGDGEQRPAA